jgi:hypothetical protein
MSPRQRSTGRRHVDPQITVIQSRDHLSDPRANGSQAPSVARATLKHATVDGNEALAHTAVMPPSTGSAGDEAGLIRGQQQGGCSSDLLWATEPPEGNGRCEIGAPDRPFAWLKPLFEDRRVDRTGADRVDPVAAVLQFGRSGAYEGTDGSLGRTVGGESGNALPLRDRGDHDDGPAIVQKRESLLRRKSQAPRVDRKDLVEALFRGLGKRLRIDDAGASAEDVTLFFSHLGVAPIEILELADVALHARDVFGRSSRGDRLVQFLLLTGENIDERPFSDERFAAASPITPVPPVITATLFCSLDIVASLTRRSQAQREPSVAQR